MANDSAPSIAGTATDSIDEGVSSLVVTVTGIEMDRQVVYARKHRRDGFGVLAERIGQLATLDEDTARENIYALRRQNKIIRGPSARFAELASALWGNCRMSSRVLPVDRTERVIEAEGLFFDLEMNTARRCVIRRRVADSFGRLYSDELITLTGNAAASIALRNATLAGIPRPVWRKAYEACERMVQGTPEQIAERFTKALEAFARHGVDEERILTALGIKSRDELVLDHIGSLHGAWSAIRSGEGNVDELFPRIVHLDKIEAPTPAASVAAPVAAAAPAQAAETAAKPAATVAGPAGVVPAELPETAAAPKPTETPAPAAPKRRTPPVPPSQR